MLEKQLLNCMGHQSAPMIIAVFASILHIFINYLISYTMGLGIRGPPIACAIYCFNTFIIQHIYISFFLKDDKVKAAWFLPTKSSFKLEGLIEFLKIGLPSIGVLCLDWWSFEVMMIFASGLSI
jgi:MATE family multidrug resistance protein